MKRSGTVEIVPVEFQNVLTSGPREMLSPQEKCFPVFVSFIVLFDLFFFLLKNTPSFDPIYLLPDILKYFVLSVAVADEIVTGTCKS